MTGVLMVMVGVFVGVVDIVIVMDRGVLDAADGVERGREMVFEIGVQAEGGWAGEEESRSVSRVERRGGWLDIVLVPFSSSESLSVSWSSP